MKDQQQKPAKTWPWLAGALLYLAIAALAVAITLSLTGCVATAADLQDVEDRIHQRIEETGADSTEEAREIARVVISEKAAEIEKRAVDAADGLLGAGAAGDATGISALVAIALHLYRNKTRKRDLASKPPA